LESAAAATAKKDILIAGLEEKGWSAAHAEKTLATVFDVIKAELLKGAQVVVKEFASMKIVEKKAHIVKDPETGHQYISPAENVVSFVPIDSFQKAIESAKLSSIVLAVPKNDPFARVIEFHFSRVGWRVTVVSSVDQCLAHFKDTAAHLVIVDHALESSRRLVEELKCKKATSLVPLIGLFPKEQDPERSTEFQITADEHLVEPFEVYTLLMLAESELARSSEEEVIFEQQVNFQFGTSEASLERANELAARLFSEAGLDEEAKVPLAAAFREAVGNAAQHGNKDNQQKLIRVQYLLDKEKITIVVVDEGPGFDHERYTLRGQTKDAVSAARERHEQGRQGGLGIMLMQRCTDKLEYNDIGNQITLTKFLKPRPKV
jgi:anti-sigma regulatory factor (Ser/Thr protein kinase)/nucleoid DNA-binding protein